MKKRFLISGLVVFLIGCGGGSGDSNNNKINGKVVDGYVKGAKVCIDLNKNFKCDENEPFTISDKNGNYTLESDGKEHILISEGGIDTENNTSAIKMYSSTKYKNITPLTSLAIKEGEEKVAEFFNISVSDIAKDPMKDNEIKNIIKDIVNNFIVNGKYELPNSFTFIDIKTPTTSNENEISIEEIENNQSKEIKNNQENIENNQSKNIENNQSKAIEENNQIENIEKQQNEATENNQNKTSQNNQNKEIETSNVIQKEGNENIPPSLIGNLTPPSIGE